MPRLPDLLCVHRHYELIKAGFSFFRLLIDTAVLKDLCEHKADLVFDDLLECFVSLGRALYIFRSEFRILFEDLRDPCCVGGKRLDLCELFPFQYSFPECFHFLEQTGRQDRKAHDLDEADIFFLDVMQLRMRVENAQRVLFGGQIVAEDSSKSLPFILAIGVIVLCGVPSVSAKIPQLLSL